MTTKAELEALVLELTKELKTTSKKVKLVSGDLSRIVVKTTEKGNLALKSYTPPTMTDYIKTNGYLFKSQFNGKDYWQKGIKQDNIQQFLKDCAGNGIILETQVPFN